MKTRKPCIFGGILAIMVLTSAFTACEGPIGPQGPQGEQGLNGEQGLQGEQGEDYPIIEHPGLVSIEISQLPYRSTYLMGEQLDLTGLQVTAAFSDGTEKLTRNYSIAGDTFTAGSAQVSVVSRQDSAVTASFEIEVLNTLVDTGLPVIYIDTQNAQGITSKEDYVNGTITIKQGYSILHEKQTMRIRGRGNATWTYPKKPYRIKLDTATDFFGMGSDRDWALLANYTDKTLLRTGIALNLSKAMNFPWTPDAKFVELVLNGEYVGNYQLVEHVKQDSNRVNVSSSTGYIIQLDYYYQNEPKWFVTDLIRSIDHGYSFRHPDYEDITNEQFTYIENYMKEFESVLASDEFNNTETGYQKYIDLDTFVKWFLFQNIIANFDPNPYITKYDNTPNSKLQMGPVWDFEWSLGTGWFDGRRPRPANYWVWSGNVHHGWYYEKLLTDTVFVNTLKTLWNSQKASLRREVLDYITETKREIYESQKVNFRRWDILNTKVGIGMGFNPLGSFDAEVAGDVQFFNNHFEWLDSAINGLQGQYGPPVVPDSQGLMIFQVYGTGFGAADNGNNGNTGSVSHSFVELYNNSDTPISLDTYSVQWANGIANGGNTVQTTVDSWQVIPLSGTIPAHGSYLIRGAHMNDEGGPNPETGATDARIGRLQITTFDKDVPAFEMSNRSYKVALVSKQTALTLSNPWDNSTHTLLDPNVVDLIGARNGNSDSVDAYKGAMRTMSKQNSVRRSSLTDTGDNSADFVLIDYRTADLTKYRPRTVADGSWTPQF